jgi:hypothetical protein
MRTMMRRRIPQLHVAIGSTLAAAALLVFATSAMCAPPSEGDVPETSVVPAEPDSGAPAEAASPGGPIPPASAGVAGAPSATPSKPRVRHHASAVAREFDVEPVAAKLKVVKADWVYSEPAKSSKRLEQLEADKFVNVTGSTHYFLRVHLKNGETGYIDPAAVDLLKPTDKIFKLTHDAGVLDKPNKWGKKLSEVHQGHDVHIVALSLGYARIRMKSGLEGFIPLTAME